MTADVELLPLPEPMGGVIDGAPNYCFSPYQVEDYARAVAERNVAARDAEIEAVTAEAFEWRGLFDMAKARADKAEARAERLAEALREARRALAWAAERLPEMEPQYEAADRALRDHDHNKEGKDG